jgi:hypothetical protein
MKKNLKMNVGPVKKVRTVPTTKTPNGNGGL